MNPHLPVLETGAQPVKLHSQAQYPPRERFAANSKKGRGVSAPALMQKAGAVLPTAHNFEVDVKSGGGQKLALPPPPGTLRLET